jgi:hypothetical protein
LLPLGSSLALLAWLLLEPLLLLAHRAWGPSARPWLVRRAQA